MSDSFNGYHVWLGIPPGEQPPNHYRLLGIAAFETDLDVIDHAADRQMAHVRTFQSGRHTALSQQILNELASARICLLNLQRKADYDRQLRAEQAAHAVAVPVGRPLPMARPAVAVVPSAAPVGKPGRIDDETFEVESNDLAPLAGRVSDEDDDFGLPDAPRAPLIQMGAPRLVVNRDASLQRAMVYIFTAVGIVIVILLLFGFLRQLVGTPDLKQWFSAPSISEPSEAVAEEPMPPPKPTAPPAPPKSGPSPDS
jgi:hypothetical protein